MKCVSVFKHISMKCIKSDHLNAVKLKLKATVNLATHIIFQFNLKISENHRRLYITAETNLNNYANTTEYGRINAIRCVEGLIEKFRKIRRN